MENFDVMKAFDPHFVIECINPESLLNWDCDEDAILEATDGERVTKYYPIYLFLMHTGTSLSNLIRMYTKTEYTHVTLSFDASMTKLYSFGSKKLDDDIPIIGSENGFSVDDINNGVYVNAKNNVKYGCYVIFVTSKARRKMMKKVQYFVDNQVKFKYDIIGLLAYVMHLPHEKQFAYFCSGFVADILQEGEVLGRKRSYSTYTPQDIANLPMAYKVDTGENFSQYREGKVKAKVKTAWNKFLKDTKIDPNKNAMILV